jgi:N-acetylglucosaminyldiphosphoundecaprenol N-acetyl-beta-D-mannosaminyltransferase
VTANLDQLRLAAHQPELKRIFESADLVTADGMTLLWASRMLGTPLPERVAGADLIESISARAAETNASVFLLGGTAGTLQRAAVALQQRHEGLRIAGVECPPFDFERDPSWLQRFGHTLREAQPDLVYVCLGFPKQELAIERLRPFAPHAWFLGLGGSLAFAAGDVSRAPRWMQRSGLEWVHRVAQEPRRLFKRFVVLGIPFGLGFLARAAATRVEASWSASPARYIELDEATSARMMGRSGVRLPIVQSPVAPSNS